MRIEAYRRYQHRLAVSGEPLYYAALVATKRDDTFEALLENLE